MAVFQMKSLYSIHFLFSLVVCFFCFEIGIGIHGKHSTKETTHSLKGLSAFTASTVNEICSLSGLDKKGWINVNDLQEENFRHIVLYMKNGMVMCGENERIIEVTVYRSEKISLYEDCNFNMVYVDYGNLWNNSKIINPLPVVVYKNKACTLGKQKKHDNKNVEFLVNDLNQSVSDNSIHFDNKNLKNHIFNKKQVGENKVETVFPDGSEAYIVCEKKNQQALFIPKYFDKINFVSPPWRVNVDVTMFRHPLMSYGRVYQIHILDNVEVIKGGIKSFFWSIPLQSMAEAYQFHNIMYSLRKGKKCTLSRYQYSYDLNLECEGHGFSIDSSEVDKYFLYGMTVLNTSLFIHKYVLNPMDVIVKGFTESDDKVYTFVPDSVPTKNEFDENEDWGTILEKKKINKHKHILDFIIANLIFVAGYLGSKFTVEVAKFIMMKKKIQKMNEEFEKSPYFFPWKMEVPNSNTTKNVLENKDSEE